MKTLTSFILPSISRKKWYILDCKMYQSLSFGRIAPRIVEILIGKNNLSYDRSTNVGNYVIIINAEYAKFDREIERFHVFQPGHPGKSLKRLSTITPQRIIERCIFNMLPTGVTKKHLRRQLKIYLGTQHPHTAHSLRPIQRIERKERIMYKKSYEELKTSLTNYHNNRIKGQFSWDIVTSNKLLCKEQLDKMRKEKLRELIRKYNLEQGRKKYTNFEQLITELKSI